MSELSKDYCKEKDLGDVVIGDICNANLDSDRYSLILATDILEHIDDDVSALKEIVRVLKPGGTVIMTVPTFMCLWGMQDIVSMHKRRYLLPVVKEKIVNSKLSILDSYYFNFLLFLPIYIARNIIRLFHLNLKSENQVNSKYLNIILKTIFSIDIYLSKKLKIIPFGVSAFILARKI
jgi:SAM-dependent methyltransferase